MGCYDGAEVCELVGSYMLNQFKHVVSKGTERKREQIVKIFKKCGLCITIQCNLKMVDFLDVTCDLYNKPIYINKQSNHPPNIMKQFPKSIAKRISDTSSRKNIFDKSISIYQDALSESGFKEELKYTPSDTSLQEENNKRIRRRRRIYGLILHIQGMLKQTLVRFFSAY